MAVFVVRGLFNQLFRSPPAIVATATPAAAQRGQSGTLSLTGVRHPLPPIRDSTHRCRPHHYECDGADSHNPTAQFTIPANAATGARTLIVTSNSEEAILPNGFTVREQSVVPAPFFLLSPDFCLLSSYSCLPLASTLASSYNNHSLVAHFLPGFAVTGPALSVTSGLNGTRIPH